MTSFRFHLSAALAVAAAAGSVSVAAVADPLAPALHTSWSTLERGSGSAQLTGDGFDPNTVYTLSADHGEPFTSVGTGQASHQVASIDLTSDAAGTLSAAFVATSDIPAQFDSFSITATRTGDLTTIASLTIGLSAPRLTAGVCPGTSFDAVGYGFPDGSYTATSPYAAIRSNTAYGGNLEFGATAAARVPAQFTITVTQTAPQRASYAFTARRHAAVLRDDTDASYDGLRVTGSCFDPSELIDITPLDALTAKPAHAVHADKNGRLDFQVPVRPRRSPTQTSGARVHGTSSGYGRVVHAGYTVPGTTLLSGHSLIWGKGQYQAEIDSPSGAYSFSENAGSPMVTHYFPSGSGAPGWSAPSGRQTYDLTSRLTMQRDGNLVLRTASGKVRWQTDTAGTGHNNRLVVRDDGHVAIYTQGGTKVWEDYTGLTETPQAGTLREGRSLLRGQALSFNATRFTLRRNGDLAVYRAGALRWTSHTAGRGATRLQLRTSGNLVLLGNAGRVVWSTRTRGQGTSLVVLADGDVVLRTSRGAVRWHTRTIGFA